MASSRHDRRRARQPFKLRCVGHTALVAFVLITTGWSSSWDSIRAAARDIQSIQADFTQEKHLQILSRPLQSHGRLIFAAPDRLRWEYQAPLPSVLLMDEGRIQRFVNRYPHGVTATFLGTPRTGEVHQNTPHQRGGNGVEVIPVLPTHLTGIEQPKVGLMDQRGRLHRLALASELPTGRLAQFLVNERNELF